MRNLIYILFIILCSNTFAQNFEANFRKKDPLLKVYKTGPYIGLQRGKYNTLELGYEFQRKAVKLIKPTTHAFNAGFDYNLTENILGFSAGYWQKRGRLDLTYGGAIVFKSNFDQNRIGITPTIGYKLSLAHLQIGYNILTPFDTFKNTNTLFVSLRLVLINNRNFKWRKRKKK